MGIKIKNLDMMKFIILEGENVGFVIIEVDMEICVYFILCK